MCREECTAQKRDFGGSIQGKEGNMDLYIDRLRTEAMVVLRR
jgi:hypothetical protein